MIIYQFLNFIFNIDFRIKYVHLFRIRPTSINNKWNLARNFGNTIRFCLLALVVMLPFLPVVVSGYHNSPTFARSIAIFFDLNVAPAAKISTISIGHKQRDQFHTYSSWHLSENVTFLLNNETNDISTERSSINKEAHHRSISRVIIVVKFYGIPFFCYRMMKFGT